jgi:transposase
MSKTFREWTLDQALLLPPSVHDFVPAGHLSRFVVALVTEELDLSAIMASYKGEKGQHPAMMVALLLYGYAVGLYSSRRIAKACMERVDFMAIVALQAPDFRTISEFRRRHLAALSALFVQVLKLCERAGLVKLGHVALDGTKIKATRQLLAASHLLEPITYTIERFDHVEVVVRCFEFLPQAFNMTVDRAVIDIDLIVVGGVHEGIAALDHPGPARKCLQNEELSDRERHVFVLPGAGVTLGIHAQEPALQHLCSIRLLWRAAILRRRASQNGFDPFDQKPLREGLTDKIVGTYLEAE